MFVKENNIINSEILLQSCKSARSGAKDSPVRIQPGSENKSSSSGHHQDQNPNFLHHILPSFP